MRKRGIACVETSNDLAVQRRMRSAGRCKRELGSGALVRIAALFERRVLATRNSA